LVFDIHILKSCEIFSWDNSIVFNTQKKKGGKGGGEKMNNAHHNEKGSTQGVGHSSIKLLPKVGAKGVFIFEIFSFKGVTPCKAPA
jgi:hypothetical protein